MKNGKREQVLAFIDGLIFSSEKKSIEEAINSIISYCNEIGYNLTDIRISSIINESKKLSNMLDLLSSTMDENGFDSLDLNNIVNKMIVSYITPEILPQV